MQLLNRGRPRSDSARSANAEERIGDHRHLYSLGAYVTSGGEGFNLWTARQTPGLGITVTLRGPSEGVRTLLDAYRREKRHGRERPEWLQRSQQFGDWLLSQQREDGSFPRSWHGGTGEVREVSGTSSYNPVPMS